MKEEHERIPLRTILQNFLNHVENLDSDNLEGSYEKEFQELKLFSEILKTSDQYCCSEGQKEVNRKKNRYKDILPFDVSRVILAGYAGVPGSDYINANFIKGASGSLAYIASQGPLPHTVNDFWRMVVECKVQVIVMACNEEEAGKHKCENYWVDKEGEEKQFGMVTVRLVKASVVCPDFLVRTMMLKYANSQSVSEERTVCQFHYSAWPDHGVPPLVRPLLDMVRLVRDTQASETLPVLVHCSAGCGRTGTICAIDYVWGLLRAGKLTNDFSLFKLVRDMRKQRIAMVQTKEQYVLVHHAVRELFCEQLRMIDSHPYENIDVNGMPLIKECSDSDSEPTYAVIGNNSCDDEKQDNKEKEVYAPPIPQKKRLHTPSSKQEKEVENLTEKQRLISQQSSDGSTLQCSGTPQKPRIAKLKAIFERGSQSGESHTRSKLRSTQQVTRSHSLGAVSKPDTHHRQVEGYRQNENDLSTSRHKLNVVAHSSPACPQPALPIKRSKSLKVLGSGDQYKLIFTTVPKGSSGKALRTVGSCEKSVKKSEAGPSSMGSDRSSKLKEQLECDKVKTKSAPSCVKSTNFNGGTADYNMKPTLNFRASEHLVPMCSQHRSSLDSFPTEDLLPFPLVNANSGVATKVSSSSSNSSNSTYGFNHMKTYNEQKTSALDKDACQIWQDCRNYLISNSKCDGYLPKGLVNKRQQSDLTGSMLKHKQFQNYSVDSQKKVTSVVVGLGVRERRNSFRQAVGTPKESSAVLPEKEWCAFESGWVTRNVQQNVDDISKKSNRTQLFCEVTSANSLHNSPNVSNSYVDVFPNSAVPVTSLQVAVAGSADISARNYNSRVQRINKPTQDKKAGIQKTSDEVSFCETVIRSPYNMVPKHNSPNTKTGVIGHKYVNNPPIQESRNLGQSKMDSISVDQVKNAPVLKKAFQKTAWPQVEQGGSKIAPDSSVRNVSGSSAVALKQLNTDYQEVNVSFAKRAPSSEGLSLFKSVPATLKLKSKSFIGKSGTDVGTPKSNISMNNSAPVPSGIKCVCDVTKPDMSKKIVTKSDPSQQIIPLCEKINGFKADTSRRMVDTRHHSHSTSVAASRSVEAGDILCNKRLKEVSNCFSDSDSKISTSNKVADSPINEKLSPNQQHQNEQVSYGLVAGVQLRRGTRDDMACQGPSTSAKVRRHASVVLLRHSLIETTPLTVWGPEQQGFTPTNSKVSPKQQKQDSGGDPRGVDLDSLPASTKPQGDSGTPLSRTLEALHLKKPASHTTEVPSANSGKTYGVIGIRSPRAQKKQHYL